jgi:hypothetical protein
MEYKNHQRQRKKYGYDFKSYLFIIKLDFSLEMAKVKGA